MHRIRSHLTYANVMVTLLAFVVLGGGAYAAFHLPKNSVRSKNIVNGQVKAPDLAKPAPLKSAGLKGNNIAGICISTPNQWASYSPKPYGPVGYYRDLDGVVHLTGRAMYCDPPSADIFRLPRGYRPPQDVQIQDALFGGGVLPIGLYGKTGAVKAFGLSTGDVVGLDGISFRCGPSGKNGCP
jgi:hypothetical protein